jgi:3-deoxy-D-manno-octulosonate 8-phosphate phosphatase KdsC-like HAD superfamily phosphatase
MDMDGMSDFSRFPTKETRMEEFGIKKIYKGVKRKEAETN